jgi:hypothetical protein
MPTLEQLPRTMRLVALLALVCGATVTHAQSPARSSGQSLYLPIYSHILHGETERNGQPAQTLMSVMVSVRNTDAARPIRVVSAQYYDTGGKRIKEYVSAPRSIAPLATLELYVPTSDDSGGSGANFVIAWQADGVVSAPLVEAVHANLAVGRSVVFITNARVIRSD